jgi:hypothetical protein
VDGRPPCRRGGQADQAAGQGRGAAGRRRRLGWGVEEGAGTRLAIGPGGAGLLDQVHGDGGVAHGGLLAGGFAIGLLAQDGRAAALEAVPRVTAGG